MLALKLETGMEILNTTGKYYWKKNNAMIAHALIIAGNNNANVGKTVLLPGAATRTTDYCSLQ